MNIVEYIVKTLEEFGVNEYFYTPGEYNTKLLKIIEQTPNISLLGCTSAENAGYAADGYSRINGCGAVITSSEICGLSILSSIQLTLEDNIPVAYIMGISESDSAEPTLNILNSLNVAAVILNNSNIADLERILQILHTEKKPVFIALTEDTIKTEMNEAGLHFESYSNMEVVKSAAQCIANIIEHSHSPIILADNLIKRFCSDVEYKEFVQKSGIPIINSTHCLDITDKCLPNYIGISDKNSIENLLNESDCIILTGNINYVEQFKDKCILISGLNVKVNDKHYDNVKMQDLFSELAKIVTTKEYSYIKKNLPRQKTLSATGETISNRYIYSRLQEYFKENDIIFTDSDSTILELSKMNLPSSVKIESNGNKTVNGWASVSAFGAMVAKPGSRVIIITDGHSILSSAAEIGTMVTYGLKPIILVINNKEQTDKSNHKFNIYYSKLTRIFESDIWSIRVSTEDDFDKALKVTQIMNKICFIELYLQDLNYNDNNKTHYVSNTETIRTDLELKNKAELSENTLKLYSNIEQENTSSDTTILYETNVHRNIITENCSENSNDGRTKNE